MTDNDYVDGILRTLAHKINEITKKNTCTRIKDKSAGYTNKTSNFPPSDLDIINKVKKDNDKKNK